MAHPHAMTPTDRRDKAREMVARTGHELPAKSLHRYARGGGLSKEEDERQDERDIAHGVHEHEDALHHGERKTKIKLKAGGHVEGEAARHHLGRRARGGPTGKKGTHVNVIVAPQGGGDRPPMGGPPTAMAPPPPRPAPAPPMAAPPPRPAMAPPPGAGMMPPGGGMRPPGMMKRGGGVKHRASGGANDGADNNTSSDSRIRPGQTYDRGSDNQMHLTGTDREYQAAREGEMRDTGRKRGGGIQKVSQTGVPSEDLLQAKRGGHVRKHRDMGGPLGTTAAPNGQQQPSPQQIQAMQQIMAQRRMQQQGASPGMAPGAAPGMAPPMGQKRGGRTERAEGGRVHMEAGSGGGEGRIEKMHEYGEGGFKPREHDGEMRRGRRAA